MVVKRTVNITSERLKFSYMYNEVQVNEVHAISFGNRKKALISPKMRLKCSLKVDNMHLIKLTSISALF